MGLEWGVFSLDVEGRNYGGCGEIYMSNFRFVPQIFRGVLLLSMSKITPPNGSCAQDATGITVADQCRHLPMLCHAPSIGSCSQFCLILQPHRVDAPFPPNFASPWRYSFVQIHGGTTLLKAKFGTTPPKLHKNDQNWGVGSSCGTHKPPFPNTSFPYEYMYIHMHIYIHIYIYIYIYM